MTANIPPLVSVTVPVRNGEAFIARALASVLAQTYQLLELIVVDDGSTDRTVEIAEAAARGRLRVVRQPASGAAAARNRGVSESHGSLLAFLDADDEWTPEKLEIQVRTLSTNVDLDMVFGHYVTIGHEVPAGAAINRASAPGFSLGTMLVKRDRFLAVGRLSTAWRVGEFLDWFARAEDLGLRHAMLPDVVLKRHVHGSNLTGDSGARADYARVIREVAARRARASHHALANDPGRT